MAVANHEIQVTWSSSNSASVSGGATIASDTMSFSASAFDAMITLKADNSGVPAGGDTVDFYALLSCGDPDGSGSDEFPNDDSDGIFLARLDTYADDPAIATMTIPVAKSVKIFARNNASSNSVVVSACINEKTA